MKGQSIAIASVIAAGVAMFVTYLSNFESLQRTRATYYQSARFADVFASMKRAPSSLESRIAAIPGVERVATRVVADVTLDVPAMAEPATGRLISVPERGRPLLNDVYLRRGRWVDRRVPTRCRGGCRRAHAFGRRRVGAIINARPLATIVSIALSRYVYAIPAKWSRTSAGSALRMDGVPWPRRSAWRRFQRVDLAPRRVGDRVIAALDRLMSPTARGHSRSLQIRNGRSRTS